MPSWPIAPRNGSWKLLEPTATALSREFQVGSTQGLAHVDGIRSCRCSEHGVAVRCGAVKSFFPMDRAEAAVLVFLILFSTLAFLPVWRSIELAGMAVFGWLMALLMIASPVLALLVFFARRRRK